jgi:hypothetical protein
MKFSKCPYHVKQGLVDSEGRLVLSDVCGVKAASGSPCGFAPFSDISFRSCSKFAPDQLGLEKQVVVPKGDIEHMPEVFLSSGGGSSGFSDMELM